MQLHNGQQVDLSLVSQSLEMLQSSATAFGSSVLIVFGEFRAHFLAHMLPLLLLHFSLICRFVFAPVLIGEEQCSGFQDQKCAGELRCIGGCVVVTRSEYVVFGYFRLFLWCVRATVARWKTPT